MGDPGHVLVIGGTGMLAGVVRALASSGNDVSVVARRADRLGELMRADPGRISGIATDYTDLSEFDYDLAEAPGRPPGLAVCWIHGDALPVLEVVARHMAPGATLIQVVGSNAAAPGTPPPAGEAHGLRLRRVVLGWSGSPGATRWLSHAEIVEGVMGALAQGGPEVIVGRITPWDDRP